MGTNYEVDSEGHIISAGSVQLGSGYGTPISGDVALTNPCPSFFYLIDSPGTITLPRMDERNSLSATQNSSITFENISSDKYKIYDFDSVELLEIQVGERYRFIPKSNGSTAGEWVLQNETFFGDALGKGYHDLSDGISLALTNPMPTVINITNSGSGLAITLPDMTEITALQHNKLPSFYFYNNGSQAVDVLNHSSSLLLTIKSGKYYKFTVTSNSTPDGDFIFQDLNIIISAVTPLSISTNSTSHLAGKISITESNTTTDGYLSSSDWNIFNTVTQTAHQVVFGNGASGVTSSANFTYNASGQLTLTDAGDGNLFILNNTNSAAVGHQMSFQLNGTNTFSIGHNNSSSQSYVYSAATILKFGTSSAEVARFSGANFGIGTASPNAPLQFASVTANRKVVMYETVNNDHQFYGFGVNNGILRSQVDATTAAFQWFAATSSSASNVVMQLNGTGQLSLGTTSPNAAVALQVDSTTQAFAPPRMTTTQKNAISSPLEGSIVYDLTLHKLCVRGAASWETITSV